jgi:O-Antigen ligase/PDZ domain
LQNPAHIVSTPRPSVTNTPHNRATVLIERLIVGCLFVFAAFAPHSIAIAQFAWLIGMGLWVVRFFFYPPPVLRRTPLDYALLGFFILTGLSAFLSYEPLVSIGKLRAASLFTIVYLVFENVSSRKILRLLVLTLIGSSFIGVIYTAGERLVGRGVKVQSLKVESPLYAAGVRNGDTLLEIDGRKIRDPEDLIAKLGNGEKRPAALKIYRVEWVPTFRVQRGKLLPGQTTLEELGIESWSRGRDWRASGFYGHYVTYAETLQLLLAVTLGLFVTLPAKRSWAGALLLITLVGLGGALLLTVTRASWVSFLISSIVILVLGGGRRALLMLALVAIPLVLAGLFVLQQKRNVSFIDRKDGSTTWRETVWREGAQLLVSKPRHLLVGVGMDSIKGHWREWQLFDNGRLPTGHMHSNLLQIALERGIPTLLVWLTLLFLYARLLWQSIRSLKPAVKASPEERVGLGLWIDYGLVLGALGGLVGFFTSGLVHYNWGDSEVVMIFYFVMGLSLVAWREGKRVATVPAR